MEEVRTTIGEFSNQLDNLIQENVEVTHATMIIIEDLSRNLEGELHSLNQDLSDLCKFVESELHALHMEKDKIRHEWESYHHTSSPASTSNTNIAIQGLKIPKPATYNGACNATTMKNFLFGLE